MLARVVLTLLVGMMMLMMLAMAVMYDYAWWEHKRGELPGFMPDRWAALKLNVTTVLYLLAAAWALWMTYTGRMD